MRACFAHTNLFAYSLEKASRGFIPQCTNCMFSLKHSDFWPDHGDSFAAKYGV